jgi:bifunctional non-homologous end joining protein LigD
MSPMLATAGTAPTGPGWAWETKWDGQRCLARVTDTDVSLVSRNRSPITSSYPEIAAALPAAAAGHDLVVDGEIVVLDTAGRPSFSLLQRRMPVQRPTRRLLTSVPAAFYLFDLLEIDGADVAVLPYLERRALLDTLISSRTVQITPYWTDVDATTMQNTATDFGLEGVVAKRTTSPYLRGQRSPSWINTPLRRSAEVIVCGWVGRTSVRSLLVGAYRDPDELVYLGDVGTGFTQQHRRDLAALLAPIECAEPPFTSVAPLSSDQVRWVRPLLVGTVEYREFTRRLRHPSWKGLRTDKTPDEALWADLQ